MINKDCNSGIKLSMDIEEMSFIQGSALSIAHGEKTEYVTIVHLCLPIEEKEFISGQYNLDYNGQNIMINLEVVSSFEYDSINNFGKNFQIGTSGSGLPSLPFSVFSDNRAKYPAFFAKIIFPFRLAGWTDSKHETGIKMDHDYERMQITGAPDSEEKIISITILNRLFQSKLYSCKVNSIKYDDITAFLEVYFRKGHYKPILTKLCALKSKTAYKDSVEEFFLSGFNKNKLFKSINQINDKYKKKDIETEEDLLSLIKQTLFEVLKHHIENRRWVSAFWDGKRTIKYNGEKIEVPKVPKNETEIQPTLHVVLDIALSPFGIHVIRESNEGIGSIDFRFLYTSEKGSGISIGAEFKLAHHKKIKKGILIQLPAYLKSIKSKSGVFIILWFKDSDGKIFRAPESYSLDGMTSWLESQSIVAKTNSGVKITPIVIDASIKPSASNL